MRGERPTIWHPFTQHGLGVPEIRIDRAEGTYLYTDDGRTILDAISSWWVNLHGHGHPHIARAIAEQAAILDQVIFAGFTHEPAERLARKLLDLAPQGLEHVFFSDSGSTAVEVAIKMAVGCWANREHARTRIIALEHAYHGDMFGAMAVGQRGLFNAAYEEMLFEVSFLPFPALGEEQSTIDALERLLKTHPDAFAALIIEPLVLGAGGMKMYAPAVLGRIAELCRRHEVLLIADEVMTGFGRTGTMFACEQAGVTPDLMCVSKGLTGGFLPMGATLATGEIFDAFYSKDRARMFFHSTSYTGNAIACAAALANLEVFEREPVEARIAALAEHQAAAMKRYTERPAIKGARHCGTIAAIELELPDAGYFAELSPTLNRFYLEQNVLLRSLGNVVYVLPPYCITPAELDRIHDAIEASLALLRS